MFDFVDIFIIGSSFSIITLAFGIFARKTNISEIFVNFFFYFLWGANSLFILFEYNGFYKIYPHLFYLNQPFELFLGPLAYYFYRVKLEGKMKFNLLSVILFAPGILSVIYFIPFFMQSPEVKLASINFVNLHNGFVRTTYLVILYSTVPYFIFCLILAVLHGSNMLSKKGRTLILHKKILIFYNLFWIVIGTAVYFVNLLHIRALMKIMILVMNLFLIFFYYLERRYDSFFDLIRKDIRELKYKKSTIKGINTNAILARIKELMELDHIYRNENISLKDLSCILNITPHQLSEILNKELKMNFKTFINSYRIEEVKKRLIENNNTGIIHIAYQCGFNSKSVFNADFYKNTGMTPTEFREKFKQK